MLSGSFAALRFVSFLSRAGSGIRLKLLEMFATQKAVVSTSVGCEGLDVKDDEHLLVADTPEDFWDAVIRRLGDANLRQRLSTNALEHVRRHYSWERIAEMYEQAFLSLLGNSAHTARDENPLCWSVV